MNRAARAGVHPIGGTSNFTASVRKPLTCWPARPLGLGPQRWLLLRYCQHRPPKTANHTPMVMNWMYCTLAFGVLFVIGPEFCLAPLAARSLLFPPIRAPRFFMSLPLWHGAHLRVELVGLAYMFEIVQNTRYGANHGMRALCVYWPFMMTRIYLFILLMGGRDFFGGTVAEYLCGIPEGLRRPGNLLLTGSSPQSDYVAFHRRYPPPPPAGHFCSRPVRIFIPAVGTPDWPRPFPFFPKHSKCGGHDGGAAHEQLDDARFSLLSEKREKSRAGWLPQPYFSASFCRSCRARVSTCSIRV